MIVFTLGDIITLSILGIGILFILILAGWCYISGCITAIKLKKQGYYEVFWGCGRIINCKWFKCGYCTNPTADSWCSSHPKFKEQKEQGKCTN